MERRVKYETEQGKFCDTIPDALFNEMLDALYTYFINQLKTIEQQKQFMEIMKLVFHNTESAWRIIGEYNRVYLANKE